MKSVLISNSEHVIIPRTENTIKCSSPTLSPHRTHTNRTLDINSELDELDREEFYRLKKVSGKKQRDNAAADAEILAARQKAAEEEAQNGKPAEEPESTDVLGEQEDNDVIF